MDSGAILVIIGQMWNCRKKELLSSRCKQWWSENKKKLARARRQCIHIKALISQQLYSITDRLYSMDLSYEKRDNYMMNGNEHTGDSEKS